ncbi:MAG: aldo/keto reductase [Kofleriaceae bacterium]
MTIPTILYGTAWKESRTESLTALAIAEGFRAIDTANQRKHYFEEAVGRALQPGLFIQTKFTHRAGQDERLPYDEHAPIEDQVRQSYDSSIAHLGHVDSYLLHGPSARDHLTDEDLAAWRAIEQLPVEYIGISNVGVRQLQQLIDTATKKITFVQNRCYATQAWDRDVRTLCTAHGIIYQGFSLLTANRDVVQHDRDIRAMAQRYAITTPQLVFAFARARGMLPLTGTTSAEHMRQDLAALNAHLAEEDLAFIETCAL